MKGSMGQIDWHPTIREKKILEILHIYGTRAVSLLFCDNVDTEYEPRGTYIGVPGPIFIQKNTKGYIGQWYPYFTRRKGKIVAILHIYGALDIILLFSDH